MNEELSRMIKQRAGSVGVVNKSIFNKAYLFHFLKKGARCGFCRKCNLLNVEERFNTKREEMNLATCCIDGSGHTHP